MNSKLELVEETAARENVDCATRAMKDFLVPSSTLQQISAAEATIVYHGVRHGHSYFSQACTMNVAKKLFSDCIVEKSSVCGEIKSPPYFTNDIIKKLSETRYFSLCYDASNKGNLKMFPIAVRFFTITSGIKWGVLEFIEQSGETATVVVNTFKEVLKINGIDINNLISMGADNTNVNFGVNHSVVTLLREDSPYLIKVLLKHIVIRWLSLFKSIESLLKVYDPLSSYFLNKNDEEECPQTMADFLV
ncbi:unnamed protein product [Didymodactylos carnosus]|uniref:DUF4371 domain-containing protein n=1 Tax=Didymodactylos carnosus TaxID=1234261 RepID=A0A8S2V1I0_9BILA|nr:unnamed protein product [Didymodactylos carnosus]CAF4348364.1 unnamed protein product [Didymodactylos carnosus]